MSPPTAVDSRARLARDSLSLSAFLEEMLGDLNDAETSALARAYETGRAGTPATDDGQQQQHSIADLYNLDGSDDHNNPNRERAVQEILSTERSYVEMLRILVECFARPLRVLAKSSKRPLLSPPDANMLFGNVEEVLGLHETFLRGLEERMSAWHPHQYLSDLFLSFSPFLNVYKPFVINYPSALKTLDRLSRDSADFAKYLQDALLDPRTNGLELRSYLILPVQRIPRYVMLLDLVAKHTSLLHPDYTGLLSAADTIREFADDLNHAVHDHEAQLKVAEMQAVLLSGTFKSHRVQAVKALVTPARRFVHRGVLWTNPTCTASPASPTAANDAPAASSSATPFTMSAMSSLPLIQPIKKKKPTKTKLPARSDSDAVSPLEALAALDSPKSISTSLDVAFNGGITTARRASASLDVEQPSSPTVLASVKELSQAVTAFPDQVHVFLFSDILVLGRQTAPDRIEYLAQVDLRMVQLISSPIPASPALPGSFAPAAPWNHSEFTTPPPARRSSKASIINDGSAGVPDQVALVHLLVTSVSPTGTAFLDLMFFTPSTAEAQTWHDHLSSTLNHLNHGMAHQSSGASVMMMPGMTASRRSRPRTLSASAAGSRVSMASISSNSSHGSTSRGRSRSPATPTVPTVPPEYYQAAAARSPRPRTSSADPVLAGPRSTSLSSGTMGSRQPSSSRGSVGASTLGIPRLG
ncbi:hypothetical protein H9P43_000599 [Blastocladiella emersonii ATCC 22665]|nr:hypothetical protein H9P43_000599 [Blastocladiella emersonii ATCC 22665]